MRAQHRQEDVPHRQRKSGRHPGLSQREDRPGGKVKPGGRRGIDERSNG